MTKGLFSADIPAGAENSEESVKCPQCGAMFGVGGQKDEALVNCPVCQKQVNLAQVQKIEASNEGY